jgi:hypothetical protein
MQSRPISTWRFTTLATSGTTRPATSSPLTSPRARRRAVSSKPGGAGSLPTWLVRIFCALFFIGSSRGVRCGSSRFDQGYNDRHAISIEQGTRITTESTEGIRKSGRRWQSDVIVDLVKRYGFPYVALNPGASFRGLHDSLIITAKTIRRCCSATTKNRRPDSAGLRAGERQPDDAIVHYVAGLLHAPMGIYYAYLDRAPGFIIGATGPLAEPKRRPFIDQPPVWQGPERVQKYSLPRPMGRAGFEDGQAVLGRR